MNTPRIQQWKQYFENNLPLNIKVVSKDDDNHQILTQFGVISHSEYGCIHSHKDIIVVVHNETQGLKTLFHEVHHYLFLKGVLKSPPEEKYHPLKKWLILYPKEQQWEEKVVESTAWWAIDFEPNGGVNSSYKAWLKEALVELIC